MDGSIAEAASPSASPAESAIVPVGSPIDIHKLIAIGRRRLPLILGVGVLVLAAWVIYTFQQTPLYTATAQVMIDTRKQNVVDNSAVLSGIPADSAAVDTEVQVLKSRSLAEMVAKDLRLDQNPAFNPALKKPGFWSTVLSLGRAAEPIHADPNSAMVQRQHQAVVDQALAGLDVSRVGLTYVIQIAYTSASPADSARLANAFAHGYLVQQLDAKYDATQQANDWLNKKVDALRQQLLDSENAVAQYKVANNLLSAQGATLTEQEVSVLDQQLAAVRAQQAEADARLQTARQQMADGSNGEDVGEAMTSPTVQALRAQRATIMQKIADLSGRYGERHPEMLKAKRELSDIDTQIKQEIQTIISNLQAQDQVARQRTASVEASVERTRGSLAGNNRSAVKLQELQQNADAVKALYDSYLNRFKETTSQQGLERSDARIVSDAKTPTFASFPNKTRGVLIGLVLAVAAGLGAAFAAERLDNGIGTAEDLERELDLAFLGSVPSLASTLDGAPGTLSKSAPTDYVLEKPLSSFAEAFRNLRASVLFSRVGEPVKVIAVTSSLPGEGKTTTSLALGRTMALSGAKTVIVDCDLRHRGLNRVLPEEPKTGLIEVLNGAATLEQALVADASGASILPLAKSAYTPKDVFGTSAMRNLVERLKQQFDVVVIDTAPVLPIADTRVLAPLADVVVLLVRWRKSPRKAAESALRLLRSVHAHIAGAALTQVDMKAQARYGYGDPGYYYRSYRKYYGQ
jgi:exopolysaccharide transport family protein